VVLLPVVIVGYFLISRTTETFLNQTDYINKINFQQMSNNIYDKLNNYLTLSDDVLLQSLLTDYVSTEYATDVPFFEKYKDFLRITETYTGILNVKVGENAKVAIYTSNKSIITDEALICKIDQNYIKNNQWCKDAINADGESVIYGPYKNSNGHTVFSICRLLSKSDAYTNIVKIEIYEDEIYKLIENEAENKSIYVVDGNNKIISSTERNLMGENISQIKSMQEIDINKYAGFSIIKKDKDNAIIFLDYLRGRKALDSWKVISVTSSQTLLNEIRGIVKYSVLICLASVLITIIFVVLFSNTLTRKLRLLVKNMRKIRDGQFNIAVDDSGNDEIAELSKSFKSMVERINYLINEVYKSELLVKDLEIEKKQAEIYALQSQINPHFLFNTMESVRMDLWQKQEYEISVVIERFSKLLRKSIEWSNDTNTIKQEIQLVDDYLQIQKYRFMDKFDFIIDIDKKFESYYIPKFTLQPIVENAICHGIERKKGKGHISITAQVFEEDLKIFVQDDGRGMTEERLESVRKAIHSGQDKNEKARIGIRNVHQRLMLQFGSKYGLTIWSKVDEGTRVEVLLPMNTEKRGEDNV
jgi:two-component system sensor histidine kinase YesM